MWKIPVGSLLQSAENICYKTPGDTPHPPPPSPPAIHFPGRMLWRGFLAFFPFKREREGGRGNGFNTPPPFPPPPLLVLAGGGGEPWSSFISCFRCPALPAGYIIGWSNLWRRRKLDTCHVVPNCFRTSILKFHFFTLLFNLAQGFRKCWLLPYLKSSIQIWLKNCFKPATGEKVFFNFL